MGNTIDYSDPQKEKKEGFLRGAVYLFLQGGPGSVTVGVGTVRAVPVFGSGGSSAEVFSCVSVEFNRERRFRFRFRFLEKLRVVETVVLENGRFVPCRKQVVLTKIGEHSDIALYPQKQRLCSSNPGNRRKWRKWRVSPRQNDRLPKAPFWQPRKTVPAVPVPVSVPGKTVRWFRFRFLSHPVSSPRKQSYKSWLAFLNLEPNPFDFLRFPATCPPQKTHFSAGKCIFLQENAFFCRKAHVSVGKCILLQESAFFCTKLHFSALCSGGQESWMVVCFWMKQARQMKVPRLLCAVHSVRIVMMKLLPLHDATSNDWQGY